MLLLIILSVFVIFLLLYFYGKLTCAHCYSHVCLINKTVLITGGNSGIGYEVALNLAARGAEIILADKDNCDETVRKIKYETNNPKITGKQFDLCSLQSIRQFAKEINGNYSKLDILINNAGIGASVKGRKTEDNLDELMQTNYFGPFLLTHLLLDLLKKSKPSRIIFTSSILAHYPFKIDLSNINELDVADNYPASKLFLVIMSNELSRRLKSSGVTTNCVHPGVVYTKIYQKPLNFFGRIKATIVRILVYVYSKNVQEGAQTTIYAAVSKEMEGISGKFLWDCKIRLMPRLVKNQKLSQDLWKLSENSVHI